MVVAHQIGQLLVDSVDDAAAEHAGAHAAVGHYHIAADVSYVHATCGNKGDALTFAPWPIARKEEAYQVSRFAVDEFHFKMSHLKVKPG